MEVQSVFKLKILGQNRVYFEVLVLLLTVGNMYKWICMLLARNKVLILTKTATCIKFESPICQCHANSVNTLFPCGFRVRPVIPRGAGGAMTPRLPYFGSFFNPILTRRGRLYPPHYYWHPRIFRPSYGPERYLSSKDSSEDNWRFSKKKAQWV